jgi:cytosine/adenosine deaminase-related metal-dependent hydrolase
MNGLSGVCVLLGPSLTPVYDAQIEWDDGKITRIKGKTDGGPLRFVVLPSFVNSHTHLGDSIAKEASSGMTLEEAVDPVTGIKTKILEKADRRETVSAIRKSLLNALASGTGSIVDFREGGEEGIKALREAARDSRVEIQVFGRLSHPPEPARVKSQSDFTESEIEELYRVCSVSDGFGISGANEYSDRMLRRIRQVAEECGKKVAVHALESRKTRLRSIAAFGRDELVRITSELRPNLVIHLTDASRSEIQLLSSLGAGIVMCPRSNAYLGNGLPPLGVGLAFGAGLGTDNLMVNSADMFREMEFSYKSALAFSSDPKSLSPRDVLLGATVNGSRIFGREGIQVGEPASFVVLDLEKSDCLPALNVHATIVNRCSQENVVCVLREGQPIWGTLNFS